MYNKNMENVTQNNAKFNIKQIVYLFFTAFFIYLLLSLIFGTILSSFLPEGQSINDYYSGKSWYPIYAYGAFPISFLLATIVFSLKSKTKLTNLLFVDNKINFLDVVFCLLMCFGMITGLSSLNNYFIKFLQNTISYKPNIITLPKFSVVNFIISLIFICVLPAFCEEILFRKLFKNALQGVGVWIEVFIIGLLFSLFHLNPAQTIYQFIVGCVLMIIVKATKSTYNSIILHFLNNLLILILYYINPNFKFNIVFTTNCYP